MRLELNTAPATEPVTLAEVKTRLRIDGATDDAGVSRLIAAATRHTESVCRRAFVTQTWTLVLDAFPCGSIALPLPPLQSVDEITYVDSNGATQTLANTEYVVDKAGMIGRVHRAYQKQWPTTRTQPMAVRVKFTAGYGAAAAVPADLVSAMMLLVAHWDQNREPVVVGTITSNLPLSVDALLAPYVIPGVA
jgi:phage conserved hypothetical protein, phiE125 gp8 family